MDSDTLEKLPLPKTVNYTDEELEVHRRFIEDDTESSKPLSSSTDSGGKPSAISGWLGYLKPYFNLKTIAVLILLFFLISSNYFYEFLNTIKYLNEQPMKIRLTQIALFLSAGYCTQYL